jgi:hypothetical protein
MASSTSIVRGTALDGNLGRAKTRVLLTDDAMLVTDLRGRRSYSITDIVRVEEAKGVPTAILLTSGQWVKLPSVGIGLGNSIRAWLKTRAS